MLRLISIVLVSLVFAGCASSQKVDTPQTITRTADGWIVAANKKDIRVEAQRARPETNKHTFKFRESHAVNGYAAKSIIIQRGDTLGKIATREGIADWKTLAVANNLTPPYEITTGNWLMVPVTVVPTQVDYTREQTIELDKWMIRLTNASFKDACTNIRFLQMDYVNNIQDGWYRIGARDTRMYGVLVQQPWVLNQSAVVLEDAKWAINTLQVVPFDDETGCQIK